jgi:hypothetical protein
VTKFRIPICLVPGKIRIRQPFYSSFCLFGAATSHARRIWAKQSIFTQHSITQPPLKRVVHYNFIQPVRYLFHNLFTRSSVVPNTVLYTVYILLLQEPDELGTWKSSAATIIGISPPTIYDDSGRSPTAIVLHLKI